MTTRSSFHGWFRTVIFGTRKPIRRRAGRSWSVPAAMVSLLEARTLPTVVFAGFDDGATAQEDDGPPLEAVEANCDLEADASYDAEADSFVFETSAWCAMMPPWDETNLEVGEDPLRLMSWSDDALEAFVFEDYVFEDYAFEDYVSTDSFDDATVELFVTNLLEVMRGLDWTGQVDEFSSTPIGTEGSEIGDEASGGDGFDPWLDLPLYCFGPIDVPESLGDGFVFEWSDDGVAIDTGDVDTGDLDTGDLDTGDLGDGSYESPLEPIEPILENADDSIPWTVWTFSAAGATMDVEYPVRSYVDSGAPISFSGRTAVAAKLGATNIRYGTTSADGSEQADDMSSQSVRNLVENREPCLVDGGTQPFQGVSTGTSRAGNAGATATIGFEEAASRRSIASLFANSRRIRANLVDRTLERALQGADGVPNDVVAETTDA